MIVVVKLCRLPILSNCHSLIYMPLHTDAATVTHYATLIPHIIYSTVKIVHSDVLGLLPGFS
jgi:hypothetical protein